MTDARPQSVALRVARTYLGPFKGRMALAATAALTVAAATAGVAGLTRDFVNAIIRGRDERTLLWVVAALVGLALLRAGALLIQSWTMNTVGHRVVGRIQVDLFGRIIGSDLARLQAAHSGAFVSAMLYDADLLRNASTTALMAYVQNGLMVIGLFAVMLWSDPFLTLAILLVGPVVGVLMDRFTRWSKKAAVGAMRETSGLSTAIMEGVDGVKVVKIEGREAYEQQRVADAVGRRQAHIIRGANIGASSAPTVEAVTAVVLAAVLIYAGWRIHGHLNRAGSLTAYLVAFAMASQALRQLAILPPVFSQGLAAAERMFQAMDIEPEVGDAPGAAPLEERARSVELKDVCFAYGDAAPALNGVSLKAVRGETVALVGPSGGGKTTILNLIPRFYDVTSGAIEVDGRDVREITLASLRRQIGLVTQEPFLFDDTIRANIAYARPDADQAAIEAAAKAAAAHDFIIAMPGGYDAPVGEAGARLSGGQRQRIAIARAFLKDAPILLLDEATSALDTESEAQVQVALARLMAGRTTVLIAHRLSTVKNADRIYVIEAGRVVEVGAHAQLVRAGGLYARLAQRQDLDFTPEAAE
jgi:subfamily B ATP-binding cassette protein MsbA